MSHVLDWPHCRNVRDLGGLRTSDGGVVRSHALVRSDSLHRLDDAGMSAVLDYGVSRVVDLRLADELVDLPGPFAGTDVLVHSAAIRPRGPSDPELTRLVDLYLLFLDRDADLIAAAATAVADAPSGAVVVHCHAGKDRTGLVVAVVLAAVGVGRDQIVADYAASDAALAQHYADELAELDGDPQRREALRAIQHCRPETMIAVLDRLESRHGGAAQYLVAGGMPAAGLSRLRDRLVRPYVSPAAVSPGRA